MSLTLNTQIVLTKDWWCTSEGKNTHNSIFRHPVLIWHVNTLGNMNRHQTHDPWLKLFNLSMALRGFTTNISPKSRPRQYTWTKTKPLRSAPQKQHGPSIRFLLYNYVKFAVLRIQAGMKNYTAQLYWPFSSTHVWRLFLHCSFNVKSTYKLKETIPDVWLLNKSFTFIKRLLTKKSWPCNFISMGSENCFKFCQKKFESGRKA